MEALGHPEGAWPSLLVAGTNGKGSVVAVVDQALRDSGLSVGRYTSPHLVRLHERIVVDGREIADGALERAVLRVRDAAEALVRAGRIPAHPTHFEAVTAAAFLHFAARRVDVAVLEVGLGGRLDATNVCDPVASAIVTIARDHEAQLGRRLPAIAREKAGVLRRGRTCVLGALPASARRAIGEAARAAGARLRDAAPEGACARDGRPASPCARRRASTAACGRCPARTRSGTCASRWRCSRRRQAAGVGVRWSRVPGAVARTRWPGRLQTLPGRPQVLLDGAHNPEGARALARHLAGGPPFVLVFGAMADKDVGAMARWLFPLAGRVVLTSVAQDRAASPRALARMAGTLARGAVLAATPVGGDGPRAGPRGPARTRGGRGQPVPGGRRARAQPAASVRRTASTALASGRKLRSKAGTVAATRPQTSSVRADHGRVPRRRERAREQAGGGVRDGDGRRRACACRGAGRRARAAGRCRRPRSAPRRATACRAHGSRAPRASARCGRRRARACRGSQALDHSRAVVLLPAPEWPQKTTARAVHHEAAAVHDQPPGDREVVLEEQVVERVAEGTRRARAEGRDVQRRARPRAVHDEQAVGRRVGTGRAEGVDEPRPQRVRASRSRPSGTASRRRQRRQRPRHARRPRCRTRARRGRRRRRRARPRRTGLRTASVRPAMRMRSTGTGRALRRRGAAARSAGAAAGPSARCVRSRRSRSRRAAR